jgi:hypothetical protein
MDTFTGDHIAKPGSQSVIGRAAVSSLGAKSYCAYVRACAFHNARWYVRGSKFLGFRQGSVKWIITGYSTSDNDKSRRIRWLVIQ